MTTCTTEQRKQQLGAATLAVNLKWNVPGKHMGNIGNYRVFIRILLYLPLSSQHCRASCLCLKQNSLFYLHRIKLMPELRYLYIYLCSLFYTPLFPLQRYMVHEAAIGFLVLAHEQSKTKLAFCFLQGETLQQGLARGNLYLEWNREEKEFKH